MMPETFHDKAKEASNKLKGYILSFSSVATGVFFFSLTDQDLTDFSALEKGFLLTAMVFFASTVVLCLFELYIDSKRFFAIAKQKEKPEQEQTWSQVRKLKRLRLRIINAYYLTVASGFAFTFVYMILRLT